MSAEYNNSTQRKSLSNHDMIMLDPDDVDNEWTQKKQRYKSIVVSYLPYVDMLMVISVTLLFKAMHYLCFY